LAHSEYGYRHICLVIRHMFKLFV